MPTYSDILFGKIALTNRLVSTSQLNECVARQERGHGLTLAEVMIERGLLNPTQARRVQKAQALTQFMRAEKIFARIALDRGLADVNVLRAAFQEQQRSDYRTRMAQLLTDRGALSTDDVDVIVEEQLLRLAEETSRIEEAGFQYESLAADDRARKLEEMAKLGAATDLDGSTFRSAVGPRGLIDDQALSRTLPVLAVPAVAGRPQDSAGARGQRGRPASPAKPEPDQGPLDPMNLTGAVIASRYRVGEKVGEGGMGTVYRAQHCLMEKTVALKVLHPSLVSSKSSLDRFRREIRAASRFQHKNVIQLYDAGEGEGGIFYMAMEFAEGETLEDLLRRKTLPLDRCVDIMFQVFGAIAEAHKKGIVHRDLKSGNIMMVKGKDRKDIVKVTDFGLAKIAQDSSEGGSDIGGAGLFKTQEGVVTGTPQYMSPEQASGEPVDHRSDLYSLGVIMFELLTGELPFKSNTPMGFLGKHIVEPPPVPSEVTPKRGISSELDQIALKLLEKKPGDRFQTAEAALAELDRRCDPAALAASDRKARRRKPDRRKKKPRSDRDQRGRPRRTRVMPSDRDAPVALTMEVEPPTRLAAEAPPPTPSLQDLGVTQEAPPPPRINQPPKRKNRGLLLIALLLGGLLAGVVGVAGYLASRLQPESPIAEAERILNENPAQAAEDLEAWLKTNPDDSAARDLLERARELAKRGEFERLVARADQLGEEWHMGTTGRTGAEKALKLYANALELIVDSDVETRMEELADELESPEPSPSVTRTPSPTPSRDPEQSAIVGSLEEALVAGKLEEARGLLEEARRSLGATHPKLEYYREYLSAEELLRQARDARDESKIAEARRLYEDAKARHPKAEVQAEIRAELEPLLRELEEAGLGKKVERALARALSAALRLEVGEARRALDAVAAAARKQQPEVVKGYETRRKALASFDPLAEELSRLRGSITAFESKGPASVRLEAIAAVQEELQGLRARIERALTQDPPLVQGVLEVVNLEAERARAVSEAVAALQPDPADEYRARFQKIVKRLRRQTEARETKALVSERLDAFRTALEYRGFKSGNAEDQAFVREGVARYQARWALWTEFGGGNWVFAPGGAWTSPSGEEHALPEGGYFIAETELTCASWDKYMRATGRKRPQSFPGPTNQPVTWISKAEVQRYCQWRTTLSKSLRFRLPTAGEWERAARAGSGTAFPWGDEFDSWRVRGKDHAAIGMLDPVRVKEFRNDRNDWGLWDMVGNVQEMTATRVDGEMVLKGGSISHGPAQCGAGEVFTVAPGREIAPFVGVRLVAEPK